ncbi:MAG: hypothetical protein AB4058_17475 [Microcystaceae cyanobacterium]
MADVNGIWLGTYWQNGHPTRFEMTLSQGNNVLSGRISDDSSLGEASLTGEIIGRQISFVKKYLTKERHTVSYTGTVSEDEQWLTGQWNIDYLSGAWEASRQGDLLIFKQKEEVKQLISIK